jgi:hypothetical protein
MSNGSPSLRKAAESLDPLMPIRTLMKTCMPRRILAGLLASGALGRAVLGSKDIVTDGELGLALFKNTTDRTHLFFV